MEFIRSHHGHREAGGLVWGVEPICTSCYARKPDPPIPTVRTGYERGKGSLDGYDPSH